jgi:regulator of protease activity HflC (stomatin/prohibitin superfamily)
MKRIVFAMLTATVLVLTGCSTATPNAGYEAVLVEKPWVFGHGGIDNVPVRTGQEYVAWSTDVIYVSMQPIQAHVKADDIMTSDGVPLGFDAVIRVQVLDSVDVIKRFGEGWYDQNVERQFFNLIRQQVRQHGMNETAIQPTAIEDIDNNVAQGMEKYFKDINMPVKLIAVTVGRANPPDSIKNQRIETAAQQQRILTEGQKKLAEDARKAAETSRAEADNAFRNAMQMSPDQYLTLENINMIHDVCKSGAKCTFISNGSKSQPILDAR